MASWKQLLKREKKKMSDNDNSSRLPGVTWTVSGDGMPPREAPWGFVVRNPLVFTLPPNTHRDVRLHVSVSTAVLAFPTRAVSDYVSVPQMINAGVELVVRVENKSTHMPLVVESGESLVNVFPLVYDHGKRRSEVG